MRSLSCITCWFQFSHLNIFPVDVIVSVKFIRLAMGKTLGRAFYLGFLIKFRTHGFSGSIFQGFSPVSGILFWWFSLVTSRHRQRRIVAALFQFVCRAAYCIFYLIVFRYLKWDSPSSCWKHKIIWVSEPNPWCHSIQRSRWFRTAWPVASLRARELLNVLQATNKPSDSVSSLLMI